MTVPLMILASFRCSAGCSTCPGVSDTLDNWLEHTLGSVNAGKFNLLVALVALRWSRCWASVLAWHVYGRQPAQEPAQLRSA